MLRSFYIAAMTLLLSACASTHINEKPFSARSYLINYDVVSDKNQDNTLFRQEHLVIFEPTRYEIKTIIDVSLLNGSNKIFISTGKIYNDRLIPETFKRIVQGKEMFNIDIEGNSATVNEEGRIQHFDHLSNILFFNDYLYQIMAFNQPGFQTQYDLLHSYGVQRADYAFLNKEWLNTNIGRLETHKFKFQRGYYEEEIWLSPSNHMLPVQFSIHLGQMKLLVKVTSINVL